MENKIMKRQLRLYIENHNVITISLFKFKLNLSKNNIVNIKIQMFSNFDKSTCSASNSQNIKLLN